MDMLLTYISKDEDGKTFCTMEWKYRYDSHNNWITQTELTKNNFTNVAKRKIIYKGDLNKPLSQEDLIGKWEQDLDELGNWIELKSDKTYDKGYDVNISDSGTSEMNKGKSTLTFRSKTPDNSEEYNFLMEDFSLILSPMNSEEKLIYFPN